LYIKENKIVGCIIAEAAEKGFMVKNINIEGKPSEESMEKLEYDKEIFQKVNVGVSRMWVHDNHRKLGIATKLMDSLRKSFIFGYIIPKEMVAFSQPTNLGAIFALNYLNNNQFLVYFSETKIF
jgi:N-acetyltransferase